jgi:hypothetical protein
MGRLMPGPRCGVGGSMTTAAGPWSSRGDGSRAGRCGATNVLELAAGEPVRAREIQDERRGRRGRRAPALFASRAKAACVYTAVDMAVAADDREGRRAAAAPSGRRAAGRGRRRRRGRGRGRALLRAVGVRARPCAGIRVPQYPARSRGCRAHRRGRRGGRAACGRRGLGRC